MRYGINLNIVETEFNQVAQAVFLPESPIYQKKIDAILVAIDYRGLPFSSTPGNEELAKKNLSDCLSYISKITDTLKDKSGAQIILQNFVPPVESLFGNFERRLPGTLSWLISNLNYEIDKLYKNDISILDVSGLASNLGLENWHDLTQWNIGKLSFSQKYLPIYAEYVCRILASKAGKSRRCLVLDLDNTLWGGVIGDDGLDGILIGNGDPTSEAYLELQRVILNLSERGIVLAVSSKNEEAIARQVFKEHPEMLLREKHISVFQANWKDKASNIKAISEALSLGLESIVFLDDNPAERMQVRNELPEVAVPELPDNTALYARTLIAAGYFEAITFSEEDRNRVSFYQDNFKRIKSLNESSDIKSYLKTLNMEIIFSPFNEIGRSRIAQLISKSNQFNLTTKRYTEIQIKEFEENNNYFTRQIRLKDIFGDNGMISVLICNKSEKKWEIDTWLMSCRVLGRGVEKAVLQDIVINAIDHGVEKLVGYYKPTARNIIVKDHYKKLNFIKTSAENENETWELDLKAYEFEDIPMEIKYVI